MGKAKASDRRATSAWSLRFSIREGSLQGRSQAAASLIPEMSSGFRLHTPIVQSGLAHSLHNHFIHVSSPARLRSSSLPCVPVPHIEGAQYKTCKMRKECCFAGAVNSNETELFQDRAFTDDSKRGISGAGSHCFGPRSFWFSKSSCLGGCSLGSKSTVSYFLCCR